MSSSVPDEGAPCSFDKWKDLSTVIAGPYDVRGNYCRAPAEGKKERDGGTEREREKEERARMYETLNASQHCRLADRGIACTADSIAEMQQ